MNSPRFFTDFEPYCATIAHADMSMRVLGMEEPRYWIFQSVVGRLAVQWAQEGSGQLAEGMIDRAAFGLYMQLNSRPRTLNGMGLDPDAIVVLPPGAEFCFSCDHANSWFAVRVPVELLLDGTEKCRDELVEGIRVVRPGHEMVQGLRETVLSYLRYANQTSILFSSSVTVSDFEDLILSIARKLCFRSDDFCLESEETATAAMSRHRRVAQEASGLIESTLDGPVSIAAIAKTLGVSERTLLTAFRSRYQITPRDFLQAMRLNRARTMLRQANYREVRIQDIAAECGFWDFGRFAARYQQLFGELPAQTLRRSIG